MQNLSIPYIIKLAIPLILANSIVPILGISNIIIVGHLAEPTALAAIALGTIVFDILFKVFNFLRMSTTGLISQNLQNRTEVRLIVLRGLFIALLIGAVLIALQAPLGHCIQYYLQTSLAVKHETYQFFKANIWSAPAELIIYVITGWLIASKQTNKALILVIILLVIAVPLAYAFVDIFHWQARGIALANVIATFIVALVGLCWLEKHYHFLQAKLSFKRIFHWHELKSLLALNMNVFIRTLAVVSVFSFFTFRSAQFGVLIVAANAILLNLMMFSAFALDGLANVTESFVGTAFGERQALGKTLRNTLFSSLLIALLLTLIYWFAGSTIINLLSSITNVQNTAKYYLPWAIFSPLMSVWAFWFDGVFIGATKGVAMRNAMLLASLLFFVSWYFTQAWQNTGLWFSLMLFMFMRAVIQSYVMSRRTFWL